MESLLGRRDMTRQRGVIQAQCPSCEGDGRYHGPEPEFRNCLRCGGYGTIVLTKEGGTDVVEGEGAREDR